MSCLYHADELCPCGNMKKKIRFRYTLDELPSMLSQLKKRADSFENWCQDVKAMLDPNLEEKHGKFLLLLLLFRLPYHMT